MPTSAGGVHDVITRIWADRVKSSLGTIVIENRAGGGSSIALNYVAQSPADGYLLLNGSTSTLVLREGGGNRAYDALKDIVLGLDRRRHLDLDRGASVGAGAQRSRS